MRISDGSSDVCSSELWQNRTLQWLQCKSFENSTPVGPVLATVDEVPVSARITTTVDGELVQDGRIDDLVFGPAAIVSYISQIFPLDPGDKSGRASGRERVCPPG